MDNDIYENDLQDNFPHNASNIHDMLRNNNINIERKSQDKNSCNNYGNRLLEMCKTCELFILNGRCEGNDKNTGAVTCKNSTMVDYALVYANTLHLFKPSFYVFEYSCLLSDVHSSIHVSLSPKSITNHLDNSNISSIPNDTQNTSPNYSFDNNSRPKRMTNVNQQLFENFIKTEEINQLISDLNNNDRPMTEQIINTTTSQLNNIIIDAAMRLCGTKNLEDNKDIKTQSEKLPAWFNHNCKTKRKIYHKARKKYNTNKHRDNLISLQKFSKQYKKNTEI